MNTIEMFALSAAVTGLVLGITSTAIKLFEGLCGAVRGLPQKKKHFIAEILLGSVSLVVIIYLITIK